MLAARVDDELAAQIAEAQAALLGPCARGAAS